MATYNAIKYNVDFGGSSGHLIPIASSTFSNSSGVTFTTLQQTIFDEHLVVIRDFHNDTDNRQCTISFSSDGSNYNRPVTSTFVNATKREDNGTDGSGFNYQDDFSHGNGTGGQELMVDNANDSDNAVNPRTSVNKNVAYLFSPPSFKSSGYFCSCFTCLGSR